jgi:rhodanese-related sulfurtransferase
VALFIVLVRWLAGFPSLALLSHAPLRHRWHRNVGQGLLVSGVAIVAAIVFNCFYAEGLLAAHGSVAHAVQESRRGSFIPRVTLAELEVLRQQHITVVDARRPIDYAWGHIPGSVSIPVGSTGQYCRQQLASGVTYPIVVYCQSLTCPFSEQVAETLYTEGYTNLRIFGGGWEKWSAAHPEDDPAHHNNGANQ